MRNLSLVLILLTLCLSINQTSNADNGDIKTRKKIPVINLNISYPKTTFTPETEVTYIPLETNKNILFERGAHVYHISDKRILITNWNRGDVFIFGMDGKIISHFNAKGGTGCIRLRYAVYDEKNKEVFILDDVSDKIVVFSEEGAFKRTLRFPSKMNISMINNFDENSMVAFNEHLFGPLECKQPYMFISKKDGSILSSLNITMNKANPEILVSGNDWYQHSSNYTGNCKFGEEYILSNRSSDTIYLLKQDKTLIPIFVQSPSVFSEPLYVTSMGIKTDEFVIFSVFVHDLKAVKKTLDSGKSWPKDEHERFLKYEFKTGRFFECNNKYWAERIDIPKNMSVKLIDAYQLIEMYKLGGLTGKMKEVAAKLKAEDNPVVEIIKYK